MARARTQPEIEPTVWCIACEESPRTLLSVAYLTGRLLSASTTADARTSEKRMNSWRMGVQVLPVRVRKSVVFIHSSVVDAMTRGRGEGGSCQPE